MIWSKEETLPRAEIEKIQLERLKESVAYIYEKVAPYREKMDAAGVKPEDIQTLADLQKLPFTNKSDFRENYPTGLFAVDKKDFGDHPLDGIKYQRDLETRAFELGKGKIPCRCRLTRPLR